MNIIKAFNLTHRAYRAAQAGFSLIELSVALFIAGVMITAGLVALNAVQKDQASSSTKQKQVSIRDALIDYLRTNRRLPCPDTNFTVPDGIENRATAGNPATACSAVFGIVPYVTLGLPREAVHDGWGNFFSYHISNTTGSNIDWTITANFNAGNTGLLTVNTRVAGAATLVANQVVAVVVSHGPNGFGAYTIGGTRNTMPSPTTSDESSNARANAVSLVTYYQRVLTTDDAATGGAIDDIVLFVTADELLRPLFKDGLLLSPAAHVSAEMQKIKLALIDYARSKPAAEGGSACATVGSTPKCRNLPYADVIDGFQNPPNLTGVVAYRDIGLSLADVTDPWGLRYNYTVNTTAALPTVGGGISSSQPSASTIVITLTSYGPNRAVGGGDDITVTVSASELRGYMSGLLP